MEQESSFQFKEKENKTEAKKEETKTETTIKEILFEILEKYVVNYLGKNEPLTIGRTYKFLNALLGASIAFIFAGVKLFNWIMMEVELLQSADSGTLDSNRVSSFMSFIETYPIVFILVFISFAVLLAIIITCSIKNGSPLRLFFFGVTVPVLAMVIANSVTFP